MLEYLHGGDKGTLFGAWDLIASFASQDTINKLLTIYKRGRYLRGVLGKAVQDFNNSEEAFKQAVAMKYQNYLSRRKFNLVCKTQSWVYNGWMDAEIALPKIISDLKVDQFLKSLDIGHVCQISNYPGLSGTVAGLVFDSGLAFSIASLTKTIDLVYWQQVPLHFPIFWWWGSRVTWIGNVHWFLDMLELCIERKK